ncbi:hypothetical protein GW17_00031457 [Ensete ventricosum]|nr:hypothetical protein GW17_00031457 [Ensete ventricosum]
MDNSNGNDGSYGQQQQQKLRTIAVAAAEAPEGAYRWRRNLRSSPSTVEVTAHGATTKGSYGLLLGHRTHPSATEEGLVRCVCGRGSGKKHHRRRQKQR